MGKSNRNGMKEKDFYKNRFITRMRYKSYYWGDPYIRRYRENRMKLKNYEGNFMSNKVVKRMGDWDRY